MDWLYSGVQVWHLLCVLVVALIGIVAAIVNSSEISDVRSESVNWFMYHNTNSSHERGISQLRTRIDALTYAVDHDIDRIDENIDHLYLPWWKRKLIELLEAE